MSPLCKHSLNTHSLSRASSKKSIAIVKRGDIGKPAFRCPLSIQCRMYLHCILSPSSTIIGYEFRFILNGKNLSARESFETRPSSFPTPFPFSKTSLGNGLINSYCKNFGKCSFSFSHAVT